VSPYCTYQCDDPNVEYKKYYCKSGTVRIVNGVDDKKTELITNGPMMQNLNLYDDFGYFSGGGIYQPATTNNQFASHTVVLIGWGLDGNNKLYWLCKNSWGTWWGDLGYFKVYDGAAATD
jgi:C1A family cysteine protease